MGGKNSSRGQIEIGAQSLLSVLAPIFFEWLLIFLLLTEAAFSYFITKFARYCKLQPPCLICSRLDHVFGHEKHCFYWDLLCGAHKLEISSHVLCSFRDKLVDFQGPCDGCILSSTAVNKSNAENYKNLVGSCMEVNHDSVHLQYSSVQNFPLFSELCISKESKHISFKKKQDEPEFTEINLSSSNELLCNENRFDKKRGSLSGSCSSSQFINQRSDPLSHVGYTELKIASDTESDNTTYDDNATASFHEDFGSKKVVENRCVKPGQHSPSLAQELVPIIEPDDEKHEKRLVMDTIDLVEMEWHQTDSANIVKTQAVFSLPTPHVDVQSASYEVDANRNGRTEATCSMDTEKTGKIVSGPPLIDVTVETGSQMSSNLELGDAYRLVEGGNVRQLSETVAEQWDNKDSAKVSEDVKLLVSQISASRVSDVATCNDVSPSAFLDNEEMKASDASGYQLPQRRVSLERNESGFESIDGSVVSEIEGESLVDRLKRQVEHDTRSLKALYKELEEERNASAVAASQAMAMITRLQEEKAALHMEALQYLREVEEQAEYDTDALQNANDLLVEKEKEVQDLDEEFRSYRMKFPSTSSAPGSESEPSSHQNECGHEVGAPTDADRDEFSVPGATGSEADPTSDHPNEDDGKCVEHSQNLAREVTNPLLVLEEEKICIAESLQKLKMKIIQLSRSGAHSENKTREKNDSKVFNREMDLDENGFVEENICHSEGDGTKEVDGNAEIYGGHILSSCNGMYLPEKNDSCAFVHCGSVISESCDLASLGVEVSILIEKLEALDENFGILSNVIRSFVNQKEGMNFIREIIHYLQELRVNAKKQSKNGLLTC